MRAVLDGELRGVYEDRRTAVASFLREWLAAKKEVLAPTGSPTCPRSCSAPECAAVRSSPCKGRVFARPDGLPLRPQWVLDQLRKRTVEAGVPKIGLHDLRHTAASIMIAEDIPVAVVSKTMRHSTLAITINLYGHLLKDSADDAVKAVSTALDDADAQAACRTGPAVGRNFGRAA